jgi:glycosyltransferase involved in cell wall biosynthesis
MKNILKNKIVVVFSSHLGDEKNNKFINHIHNTIGCKHDVVCYTNYNQYSLTEVYNRAIDEHNSEQTIMVFCHPDIIIKTMNWGKLLLGKFNNTNFNIIGVAGSTFLGENGMWWEDRSKMCGIVEHTNGLNTWVSEYSPEIHDVKEVVVIDGLFMGVDCNSIVHRFDETYNGFHFYEISMVVPNYLDGCDIGVTTSIRVLHESVGQTNEQWELNRQQFAQQYADELPLKHVSEGKLRVLICCQFFKNYTGSEVSNYELSRELVKLGCDVTLISSMVGEPLRSKAIKNGVKVYSYSDLPNYKLNSEGQFQFIKNEKEFDIIHINHKPIGDVILQLYPNTPAVMHVRSEVIPTFEEPIINPMIKRYISIRETITEYITSFGISGDKIVEIDNPFDTSRFNTDYKPVKNEKEVVLFIGTLDHLRRKILEDLIEMTNNNNQELWIIGADNMNYVTDLQQAQHVKYLGVKSNVEKYIKKCDYTAGIFKGRTTIEGFLCGKRGWIYYVDKDGKILNKELREVPADVEKYKSDFSAKKVFTLYEEVLDETWL